MMPGRGWLRGRRPVVELIVVDVRERDLEIEDLEVLTAAMHEVQSYQDRVACDARLARDAFSRA